MELKPVAAQPDTTTPTATSDAVRLLGDARLGCAELELLTGRLSATPFAALLPHLDRFDAALFSLQLADARAMDPQQRLLLDASLQALHGRPATPADADTAVFVGVAAADHTQQLRVCLPYPPRPAFALRWLFERCNEAASATRRNRVLARSL